MHNTRKIAIDALGVLFKSSQKPKDILDSAAHSFSARDRGFIMEIVYGVLRHRDTLDMILSWLIQKPSSVPTTTFNNLRVGIYQIFFMRVPDFAAVNEAVNLEGRNRGLVNGVLRNSIRKLDEFNLKMDKMKQGISSAHRDASAKAIASLTSHPLWLVQRWIKRMDVDEAYALAQANNLIPPLTLRANILNTSRDELLERLRKNGHECEPTKYAPDGVRLNHTTSFDALDIKGDALVQDEAAQLVSLMLMPTDGARVLDACAAPGGKTAHLANLVGKSGEVVALDIDGARLERLNDNMQALVINNVTVHQADLLEYSDAHGFDSVLLDAPCTAIGVIRRNPDIKYRRKRVDLKKFPSTQYELLRAASKLVRPGGRLTYAVCSTEPQEGEEVVARFLHSSTEFDIISSGHALSDLFINRDGYMRTWPHRDMMDGFFAVTLGKAK